MEQSMPLQPVSNPEAPPPRSEIKGIQPEVKPPNLVELSSLRSEFDSSQIGLNRERDLLKTAQDLNAGRAIKLGSPEHQLISKRRQAGESLEDIIQKTAANVGSLYEAFLDKELPYREAEVSLFRSEVGSPTTDQDIIRTVDVLEHHNAIKPDDPALAEVNRRKQAGESLTEIKTKAQQALDLQTRQVEMLRIAELMKRQTARPLGTEIEVTIRNRMQAGESLDDIIAKTRANVASYAEVNNKKSQLAQILKRIEEIKSEKQVIAETRQQEQELATQQQIQQARQQVEGMAGKKHEDLNSFLVGEFGIEESQITLLPEFSTAPKDETVDARQLRIAQNLMELLRRKGALASSQENSDFYEKQFGLTGFHPPDEYLKYPAGATFLDPKSGDIKVYFNPGLQFFKADYQLLGVLEESIHWSQLKQSGRDRITWKDEAETKDKHLSLAKFVGYDEKRMQHLNQVREHALSQLQNAPPQTPIE